jgi:hypothetical protein
MAHNHSLDAVYLALTDIRKPYLTEISIFEQLGKQKSFSPKELSLSWHPIQRQLTI